MAKVNKLRRKYDSQSLRRTPYALKAFKDVRAKRKTDKASKKKDWEDVTCSVCMESPHNAVLLLCSSYDKGCRPYMCATGHRYSNCLEQYQKAYTKVSSIHNSQEWDRSVGNLGFNSSEGESSEKGEKPELLCPLCRGQVKGCTVVERARKHLNAKKRNCLQDKCSFSGTYRELKKHVKSKHPLARPRAVDPVLQEKWKKLERERERSDVISTIMSSTPGAVVLGDYVLEPNHGGMYSDSEGDSDSELDDYIDDLGFGPFVGLSGGLFSQGRFQVDFDSLDDNDFSRAAASIPSVPPRRSFPRNRVIFGRAMRQRTNRGERAPGRFV
ncbi:uncharacterized protein LOC126793658 [Argentina anserina]|uniref:uncharacterized protein LOC126793658 n=1 Tax=Argentina anserina TaxID=57926 RepID=UPI0021767A51|nr:uncharacterized protein LOC126793658 [Potentilla anserina]XP_050376211.1 uncharacterized protein LOC126793658 [Potentilla anserina]